MNSKLAGTTMGKVSFEGVVALKSAGLVSTVGTLYSPEDEQRILFETSRPNRKRFYSWLYPQVYYYTHIAWQRGN